MKYIKLFDNYNDDNKTTNLFEYIFLEYIDKYHMEEMKLSYYNRTWEEWEPQLDRELKAIQFYIHKVTYDNKTEILLNINFTKDEMKLGKVLLDDINNNLINRLERSNFKCPTKVRIKKSDEYLTNDVFEINLKIEKDQSL